ncbi:NUDIX hydrolase [Cellulomonas sp. APG4]|uniref:NUDIX hydrolase n=1 Tax=Cellulomonas sp. APG4 TaxID=1538656 RepID=UPI00351BBF6F
MTAPRPDAPAGPEAEGLVGAGWRRGPDGLYARRGARVVVLDDDDRLLLLRAHDAGEPTRSWWFTVGGGIDPGEDARAAAVREAWEEVGLRLDPTHLVGPVWTRSAVFDFARVHCRQDEEFFVARVAAHEVRVDRSTWTVIEQDTVDEVRWWSIPDLARCTTQVYPEGLADLAADLVGAESGRGPAAGPGDPEVRWDGVTVTLPAQRP